MEKKQNWWKLLVLVFCGVVAAIALFEGFSAAKFFYVRQPPKITPEISAALNLSLEDARLAKLLPLAAGPGNAAEDLWESSHHAMCGLKGAPSPCKSGLSYPWTEEFKWVDEKKDINWDLLKSDKPEDIKKFREWAQIPELEVFRKAAGKSGYQMLGAEFFLEPGINWMYQPIPYYVDYLRYTGLGLVRARELEEQGKKDEALAWYQDLMRIGNHLERDILIGEMIGMNIKRQTSEALAGFYERQADPGLARQWKDYHDQLHQRHESYKEAIHNLARFSEEDLKKAVEDPNLSSAMRAEFYFMVVWRMCYSNPWRFFFGPSASDKAWLYSNHFDRPEFKTQQWMGAVEAEAGFGHRALTGIKAANYL